MAEDAPSAMPATVANDGQDEFFQHGDSPRRGQNENLSVAATKSRSLMSLKRPAPPNLVHDMSTSHFAMQVGGDAEREAVAAFDEVAARAGRGAVDVMLPVEARQHVPGTHEARVFQAPRDAIAIGSGIGEAVLRLDQIQREAVRRRQRRAVPAAQLVVAADVGARAVEAQAATVRAAGELVRHVLDVRDAGFGDEHHLRGR